MKDLYYDLKEILKWIFSKPSCPNLYVNVVEIVERCISKKLTFTQLPLKENVAI